VGEEEDPWGERVTEQQLTQVSYAPLGSPLEAVWAASSPLPFFLPLSPLPVKSSYSGMTVALEINESKVVLAGKFLQFILWCL